MLDYAASRRHIASRPSSPKAMLLIVSAHIALLALVMSARMELPRHIQYDPPTTIQDVPVNNPPREHQIKPPPAQPHPTALAQPQPQVPLPSTDQQIVDATPATIDFGKLFGSVVEPVPPVKPVPAPEHRLARLLTPPSELKPPYPQSKILSEEEAVLTLRLSIDDQGRVVSVLPVGRADAAFLDAARRHLMAHWRYQPAMEDGHAIASSIVITLRFQLGA
jgi:protein TonB